MTDRQQTGIWFVITGVLLLSLSIFASSIVNWAISSGFILSNTNNFSNEQSLVLGGSALVAIKLISLSGLPLVITGLAQIVTGANKTNRK